MSLRLSSRISKSEAPWSGAIRQHPILEAVTLAPRVRRLVVHAPLVAARHRPGNFVIIRLNDESERIPLTVAEADPERGTITLIIQAVGATTEQLCRLETGDTIRDVAGPLGTPTHLSNFGHVVLVGGGVGTAVLLPMAHALKQLGNRISLIVGGRSKEYVLLEKELCAASDAFYPCTDDGSYGYHGFVTSRLTALLRDGVKIDHVITAGPLPMMKAISEITRQEGIKTIASLVTIMVDGTGMCGGCRVSIGGEQRFACVDGPEFDAHKVDFAELVERLKAYRLHEKIALFKSRKADHECRVGLRQRAMNGAETAEEV